MNPSEQALQESNRKIAQKLMKSFAMDNWFDFLHDDLVLEFPCAASIGMPERVAGRQDCAVYLGKVMEALPGLKFMDIEITDTLDPAVFVLQYKSRSATTLGNYENVYVAFHRYRDGKLAWFKEFWNTKPVIDLFGANPGAAFI
jgi:ketosteroid isomerase-like protein